MLEAIRERAQGWMAKFILALIIIPFALWGVDSYFMGTGKADTVAKVGDSNITRQAFAEAIKEQADQMHQVMGVNFDPTVLETREFREQVLTLLTEEEAMLQEAKAAGLQIPDSQIVAVLQQLPPFQEAGKFSPDRYKRVLAQRGFSPAYFEHRLKRDITLQVQQQPIIAGTMVPATSIDLISRLVDQRREIAIAEISPANVAAQVTVTDQDVQRYYQAHRSAFTEAEKIRVEYVVLSLDDLAKTITVTDSEVQDYFAANATKFAPPEQRSASHILIAAPEGDMKARKQAKAKAESLFVEIQKAPERFAELAKRESQDPGSASLGGSLGTFGRGVMVKPFEDAVFSMKPGELRLVETQFGFHIIRLDGVQAKIPSLTSVRQQVEEELRRQQAQKQFANAAEQFSNLVYEQGASLKPAANALRLPIQTSGWLTKKGLSTVPFNSTKLLEAIFSTDAIKSRQNIEPVEIARNVLVAARVIEHQPARIMPIAEVSADIRQKLALEKTLRLTEKQGQLLIERLKQGKEADGLEWSAFRVISRRQPGEFDPKTLQAIMRADTTRLPSYVGMSMANGGYRIIRITRVIEEGSADTVLRSAVESGLHQTYARTDAQAQIEVAKSAHKVEIRRDAFNSME